MQSTAKQTRANELAEVLCGNLSFPPCLNHNILYTFGHSICIFPCINNHKYTPTDTSKHTHIPTPEHIINLHLWISQKIHIHKPKYISEVSKGDEALPSEQIYKKIL